MDRRIFHITNLFSHSLGQDWSVETMAAEVRMSVPHFQRLFKETAFVTPMAYLNDLRLESAREMLGDPSCFLQVKEIGFHVGMTNDSRFSNAFKAKFGMTPTEYRQLHADIHQSNSPD